ncbi:MAG: alginate export family protein [Candidatus Omnitrophica bacterium]|nr:alginate export family protein [Candidatus Omnitrophota bacterium]
MRRKATLALVVSLGLLAAWTLPAFAEVQNVRVSGDITSRMFHRENLDLTNGDGGLDTTDNFFMTTTGVNVGADLTENVSTFIRLANERDWDNDAGGTDANGNGSDGSFDISQAYVTLKELFYSPLTLRIGAQPIVWGRGFVLGSALLPSIVGGDDRLSSITANEFTEFTAFDAIRATLDLSNLGGSNLPLTADYVYIKLDENTAGISDDITLQGVNFGTKIGSNTELEAYYLNKLDKAGTTPDINKNGNINTIGFRGSTMPVESLSTWGELAYQFGTRGTDASTGTLTTAPTGSSVSAWALDLGLEYTWTAVSMTPKAGAEWIFWSGKEGNGGIAGWDPIARGYYTTALREFQTDTGAGFYATDQALDTSAATNQNQISFWGGLKPIEDLSATSRLTFFWQDVGALRANAAGTAVANGPRRSFAGTELDTNLVYDYTEDVQFGLLYGFFVPGSIYTSASDNVAQEVVTTVKVQF